MPPFIIHHSSFPFASSLSPSALLLSCLLLPFALPSHAQAPQIAQNPTNQTVLIGSNATFTITATGTEPLYYQWFKNGSAILNATNFQLLVSNSQLTDSGTYFCVVSNSVGSVTSAVATLIIPNVVAWGFNDFGQCNVPASLTNAIAVAGGDHYSIALRSDGTLVGWGENTWGQISIPVGLSNVIGLAAGQRHGVALKSDGTVAAWGNPDFGKTIVPSGLSNVVAIAAGNDFSLALKSDGTVVAWGIPLANPPAGLSGVIGIAAGRGHCLAVKSDGTIVAWGDNYENRSGVATLLGSAVSVAAGAWHNVGLNANGLLSIAEYNGNFMTATGFSSIAAGFGHTLGLSPSGDVVGFGANVYGQANSPAGLVNVFGIGAGFHHSLAVIGAPPGTRKPVIHSQKHVLGTVTKDFFHRPIVENGATSFSATGLPTGLSINPFTGAITGQPQATGTFAVTISATNATGFGQQSIQLTVNPALPFITSSRRAQAYPGLAFTHRIEADNNPVSINVPNLPAWLSFNSGTRELSGVAPMELASYTLTVTASNAHGVSTAPLTIKVQNILALGGNWYGQTDVPDGLSNIVAISTKYSHNLALKKDGTVIGWGNNHEGQACLTNANTNFVAIAAGAHHSLALKNDGTIVAWGANPQGEISIPFGLTNIVAIAATDGVSAALRSDGRLFIWGYNGQGQLDIPTDLTNITRFILLNSYACVALQADGKVIVWGTSDSALTNIPLQASNAVDIAGNSQILALHPDGLATIWPASSYSTPPSTLTNLLKLSAGCALSHFAMRKDGSFVSWGPNWYDELDIPSAVIRAVDFEGGSIHSLGLLDMEPGMAQPLICAERFAIGYRPYPFYYRFAAKNQPTGYGAGGLPAGLSVDTTAGLITGTPQYPGVYDVTLYATNAYGVATAPLRVFINGMPEIPPAGQPSNQVVAVGLPATFTVTPAGIGPFTYQWFKNGAAILNATNSQLLTSNSQLGDAGNYFCVASNSFGMVTSQVATLQIAFAPADLALYLPFNGSVRDESPAQRPLTLLTSSNLVTDRFGNPRSALDMTNETVYVDLPLTNTSFTFGAWFRKPTNAWASVLNQGGTGDLGKRLHVMLDYVGGGQGDGIRFSFSGNDLDAGVPLSRTDWFHVAVTYNFASNARRIYLNGAVVAQDIAQYPFTGSGSLRLDNFIGALDDARVYTRVLPPEEIQAWHSGSELWLPQITAQPRSQTNWLGSVTTLSVEAIGTGPLAYQWLKQGAGGQWGAVSGATNFQFSIFNFQFSIFNFQFPDAGAYSVVVSNSVGSVTSAVATLSVVNVVGWGANSFGQTIIPSGLSNATAVSAGSYHSLALKADGTVVGWGVNGDSPPNGLSNVVAIAGGNAHSLALRADRTVIGWGDNSSGKAIPPELLSNVVAIAAGGEHSLALTANGSVVGWGSNASNQTAIPTGLGPVVGIAAGNAHSVALCADGTVVAWGANWAGQTNVPQGLSNIVAISLFA